MDDPTPILCRDRQRRSIKRQGVRNLVRFTHNVTKNSQWRYEPSPRQDLARKLSPPSYAAMELMKTK